MLPNDLTQTPTRIQPDTCAADRVRRRHPLWAQAPAPPLLAQATDGYSRRLPIILHPWRRLYCIHRDDYTACSCWVHTLGVMDGYTAAISVCPVDMLQADLSLVHSQADLFMVCDGEG